MHGLQHAEKDVPKSAVSDQPAQSVQADVETTLSLFIYFFCFERFYFSIKTNLVIKCSLGFPFPRYDFWFYWKQIL